MWQSYDVFMTWHSLLSLYHVYNPLLRRITVPSFNRFVKWTYFYECLHLLKYDYFVHFLVYSTYGVFSKKYCAHVISIKARKTYRFSSLLFSNHSFRKQVYCLAMTLMNDISKMSWIFNFPNKIKYSTYLIKNCNDKKNINWP